MQIFYIRGHAFCKAKTGFSYRNFDAILESKLHMRKGSFAEEYCKKIFHTFFRHSVDLRTEYERYYAEEYDDFEQFLYKKKLWNIKDIRSLQLKENETILELFPAQFSYNVDELLNYEESGLELINQMLEVIVL